MKFKGWVFLESLDAEHPFMKMNRMEIVDKASEGDYEMYLMHTDHPAFPEDMRYQVAVQKSGMSFLNPKDQFRKSGSSELTSAATAFDKFTEILKRWISLYGRLSVASLDDSKTDKWESMLRWAGFKVDDGIFAAPGMGKKKYLIVS